MSESTTLQPFVKVVVSEAKVIAGIPVRAALKAGKVVASPTAGTLREMACVLRIIADSSTHGFPSFEDGVGLSGLY